jgi:hypothetical protein
MTPGAARHLAEAKRAPIAGRPSPGIRQPDTGPTSRLRAFWPASNPARPLPGLAGLGGAANLAHQQLIVRIAL